MLGYEPNQAEDMKAYLIDELVFRGNNYSPEKNKTV
jgi:hypothetical protein